VVVLDATRLERNLNLALQVLEITDRVVVVPQPDGRSATRTGSPWTPSRCRGNWACR
jgi:hypothetical protein